MPPPEREVNCGRLKLELLCRGLRVECELGEHRPILRTRAGLGSGLELVLGKDVWVNVPVDEEFARRSPYALKSDCRPVHSSDSIPRPSPTLLLWRNADPLARVRLAPRPRFYDRATSTGVPMNRIGVLQGRTLAVYPTRVCEFWKRGQNCRFCATGLNVGVNEESEKGVGDVEEVACAARAEGITFAHFNTGYYGGGELDVLEPYVRAAKRAGMLVGVQCPPQQDLKAYDRLKAAGADHFSFCFEFFNPRVFAELCPGKAETLGREAFFRAMEYASRLMGKGRVSGEIIAGLEPIEDTLRAIEFIASVGAFPTICIFRPLRGTALEDRAPPDPGEMARVFEHCYRAMSRRRIPTGIAPGVNTSLIILPSECRYFARPALAYEIELLALRAVYRSYYWLKSRKP